MSGVDSEFSNQLSLLLVQLLVEHEVLEIGERFGLEATEPVIVIKTAHHLLIRGIACSIEKYAVLSKVMSVEHE